MVIDVTASARQVFEHVCALQPRFVDFLFPDATYETPPPQHSADPLATPYGDWLFEMFESWIADEAAHFRIRLFERIIHGLLGITGQSDALGPGRNEVLVIESDGSIEPVDVLKVCGEGATRTEFNVHTAARASLPDLPELPAQTRLCGRLPAAPLPEGQRLRQSVRLLSRFDEADHRHSELGVRDAPVRYRAGTAARAVVAITALP
jgi:uncharacterized protein